MPLLAIDTATEACSAALWTESGTTGRFAEVGRGHAESILVMVDELLTAAGLELTALDAIAASVGPGAFTGVRISVSVAQGLAFGAGLPVVPVSTLEALALQAAAGKAAQVIACLDARMGEVYWGTFTVDRAGAVTPLEPARVGPPATVVLPFAGEFNGIGRGFAAHPELAGIRGVVLSAGAARALPDARDIARLGALRFAAGAAIDPAVLVPLYVRDKVALTQAERAAQSHGTVIPARCNSGLEESRD